jgi:hypothetical protein
MPASIAGIAESYDAAGITPVMSAANLSSRFNS